MPCGDPVPPWGISGGNYVGYPRPNVCPGCGRCNSCGRSYPQPQPYWWTNVATTGTSSMPPKKTT